MNAEILNKLRRLANMAAHLPYDVTLEDEDAAMRALHSELAADTVLELIALAEHSLSAQDEVLTDEQIDAHINTVLRPTGTKMANFTMQKSKDDLRAAMRSVLAATPSPSLAVRDIPREPTSEMMEAANRQREVGGDTKDCWRAMWDAAMREQS